MNVLAVQPPSLGEFLALAPVVILTLVGLLCWWVAKRHPERRVPGPVYLQYKNRQGPMVGPFQSSKESNRFRAHTSDPDQFSNWFTEASNPEFFQNALRNPYGLVVPDQFDEAFWANEMSNTTAR